jgi:hypothetical protein
MISALPGHAPKACHASNPHMHNLYYAGPCPATWHRPALKSTRLGHTPQACTGLHDPFCTGPHHQGLPCQQSTHTQSPFHWDAPPKPAQGCMISGTMPLKPAKLAIHRHAGSPLCWPMPFRHARPMPQRPASSPRKASTCRSMGHHPPATYHRRAPNLPKRHTQTGLDAKGVVSQQLRLQLHCSRTSEFSFPSLRYLLPDLLFDHPATLPLFKKFFSLFLSFLFLLSCNLFLFFILLSWFC